MGFRRPDTVRASPNTDNQIIIRSVQAQAQMHAYCQTGQPKQARPKQSTAPFPITTCSLGLCGYNIIFIGTENTMSAGPSLCNQHMLSSMYLLLTTLRQPEAKPPHTTDLSRNEIQHIYQYGRPQEWQLMSSSRLIADASSPQQQPFWIPKLNKLFCIHPRSVLHQRLHCPFQ